MTGAPRIIPWFVLLTCRGRCPTSTRAATSSSSTPPVNFTSHRRFADELTTALHTNINECSSALGISMAFSLLYPGCTGDAIVQLGDVLGFDGGNTAQLVWRNATDGMLERMAGRCVGGGGEEGEGGVVCGRGSSGAPLLKIANGIWYDDGRTLNATYRRVVGDYARRADLSSIDSSRLINEWVKNRTNGLIKSIVDEDEPLYPPHELVAINSIYLRASWRHPFDEGKTNLDYFYVRTKLLEQAHFMNGVFDGVGYSHEAMPGHQVVRLPFAESTMSMIIVLPMITTGDDASVDAAAISSTELLPLLDDLRPTRIALSLPKFEFESTYDGEALKSAIARTGIAAPFVGGSLCGIFATTGDDTSCESLFVDRIVQKTVVDVHENGTEASSATAIMTGRSGGTMRPSDDHPTRMVCDRPFQFYIVDESEGLVLFEGRVGRPGVPRKDPARPLLGGRHGEGDFWRESFGVSVADPPSYSVAGDVASGTTSDSPSPGAHSSSSTGPVHDNRLVEMIVYVMLGSAVVFFK
mmetsp:Transcript_9051/g.22098  ORF Transcript_9051/g.22098 Transcript_9051/m.22098 type:complete len:525 (-) Transcript_9051:71-1645(-)